MKISKLQYNIYDEKYNLTNADKLSYQIINTIIRPISA